VLVVLLAISARSRGKQPSESTDAKLAVLVDRIRRLLPSTSTERSLWVLVSLTAGLCEEFLYRGWLLLFFSSALGFVWAGLLVSSVFFGFAHSYQGRSGILGTAVLGLVFGLLFVFTRSLIPGQLLHTLLDLTNGLALARFAARAQHQPSIEAPPSRPPLRALSPFDPRIHTCPLVRYRHRHTPFLTPLFPVQ
jgi:membrane protease YdiL (CAAX protease family)